MGVKDPIAYYCEWMIGSIFDMKSFLFPYLLVVYKQEVLLAPFEKLEGDRTTGYRSPRLTLVSQTTSSTSPSPAILPIRPNQTNQSQLVEIA